MPPTWRIHLPRRCCKTDIKPHLTSPHSASARSAMLPCVPSLRGRSSPCGAMKSLAPPPDAGHIDKYPPAALALQGYLPGTSVRPTAQCHCLVFARSSTPMTPQKLLGQRPADSRPTAWAGTVGARSLHLNVGVLGELTRTSMSTSTRMPLPRPCRSRRANCCRATDNAGLAQDAQPESRRDVGMKSRSQRPSNTDG